MSACMTACSRSLLSASPSKAFLRNSLFLSDFLSSSLHTHLFACHFPFMSITISLHFSCLSLCPRSPCPTPFLFQSQDFLILSSYHILNPLLFFFFFPPHSASCLRARFPHAFIVYSCCFPTCSPPFPSSFLPSHTFLSVQHVISSLLLHINPSSE